MTDATISERAASRESSASLKQQKGDETNNSEAVDQPNNAKTNLTATATDSDESNKDTPEEKTDEKTEDKALDESEKTIEDKDIGSKNGAEDKEVEEEEEDEAEEAEFDVEQVVGHKYVKGKLHYHIKWKGYDSDENTWEDTDGVFCTDLIEAYWTRHKQAGGLRTDLRGIPMKDPARSVKSKGTQGVLKALKKDRDIDTVMEVAPAKRQKTSGPAKYSLRESFKVVRKAEENGVGANKSSSNSNGANSNKWVPPKNWTSWEDKVETIQTVERSDQRLLIRLAWKNGKETQHPIETAHEKCPQKLIQYYESHIKFSQA
ncbi:hypothetical protein BGZ95_008507 [Linnemannia exigua]|uniref:Chromo domain-containing protein n=1 Tax=Linnemannia exigua TaxID=604196 RepID=A0AAD4H7Q6_9FUNG|nr:hypothetical protein BGZ95_008507 [Linnemannia exigua]